MRWNSKSWYQNAQAPLQPGVGEGEASAKLRVGCPQHQKIYGAIAIFGSIPGALTSDLWCQGDGRTIWLPFAMVAFRTHWAMYRRPFYYEKMSNWNFRRPFWNVNEMRIGCRLIRTWFNFRVLESRALTIPSDLIYVVHY